MNWSEALVSRHQELIDVNALRQATVLIVGAGAVGSLAAMLLTRLGVQHFILVDKDIVASANLSRTVFLNNDIGRLKVEALADRLTAVNPDIETITLDQDVRYLQDAIWLNIAQQTQIALIAIDNVAQQLRLSHLLTPYLPVIVVVIEDGGQRGEITLVTPKTKPFCCVTNIAERLSAAPEGVSAAQGLISDLSIVVAEAVNIMLQVLQPRPCRRFQSALKPEENVFLLGRGNAGDILQANLKKAGRLSSVTINTSGKATPCPYCQDHKEVKNR